MFEFSVGKNLVYEGEIDPNEVFCEIRWSIGDLLCIMHYMNIDVTDDNIRKALKAVRYLADRSVEEGWETIGIMLDMVDWDSE